MRWRIYGIDKYYVNRKRGRAWWENADTEDSINLQIYVETLETKGKTDVENHVDNVDNSL